MRATAKIKWDGDEANLVWEDGMLSGDQRAIDFATTVDWEAYGPFGGLGLGCNERRTIPIPSRLQEPMTGRQSPTPCKDSDGHLQVLTEGHE
jgi:hypothetical protein